MGNPLGVRADPAVIDRLMGRVARQHGVFSRRQWLAGGLSDRQLQRALANRAVFGLHPGVYAVRGAAASFQRDVMAACLACGGVASHRSAAYLWGFRRFERPVVEVVVTKGHSPALRGVTVRRTGRLAPSDSTNIGSIPVTSRPRTLLDLVAVAPERVEGALDGALHRRQVSLRALERLLERVGRHHPAQGVLGPLVAARVAGRRPTESELEDDLLAVIRRHGLPEPVPQYRCGRRRIDFAYPDLLSGSRRRGSWPMPPGLTSSAAPRRPTTWSSGGSCTSPTTTSTAGPGRWRTGSARPSPAAGGVAGGRRPDHARLGGAIVWPAGIGPTREVGVGGDGSHG